MGSFLALMFIHWIGDFVCQSHWQATNKSKNWNALFQHVMIYCIILLFGSIILFGLYRFQLILLFVTLNGILHFITDAITSRISSKLYSKQDYHNFFVIIGLDQLIHYYTLAFLMLWLFYW